MRGQSQTRKGVRQTVSPFAPGFCAALIVVGLLQLGAWQPLENIVYTVLFQIRGSLSPDDRVVVIAIDEPSLKALGQYPWPRQSYTQLLTILTQANPCVVAFNILFTESSADDEALANAMIEHGRVVLAQAWDSQGLPLSPTPQLQNAALASGHIYQSQESGDGLVRTVESEIEGVPALGLMATQVYALTHHVTPWSGSNQRLWVNWLGRESEIPTYSYIDVIQGRIPSDAFQGKIVLIGITASGFDPLQTPFDRTPPTTGVYLHATVISNALQHNFLRVPAHHWVVIGLLLAGPGLSYVMTHWLKQRWLTLAGLCAGWCLISILVFRAHYWLPTVSPQVLFIVTTGAVVVSDRWKENLLMRQEIRRLWQTYHQDLVHRPLEETQPTDPQASPLPPVSFQTLQMAQLSTLAELFGRSQSAQAAISRSLSIGLVAADLDGRVWFCNPVATSILNLRVGDRLPVHLVPQWLRMQQWQTYLDQLQDQVPIEPLEIQRGDRWFELKLEPLVYHSNDKPTQAKAPGGLLLLFEDITAKKRVEENLKEQMQTLEQLNQMKDDFLSTVSHELRTPMSNIKMATHMLKMATSEDQRNRYLQILQDECNRETELINDLLDLQRLEAEHEPLSLDIIDLHLWLPQLVDPFHQRTQSRQQILQLHIDPSLPLLISHQSSLARIVVELLNNACKYTPPGEIISVTANGTTSHFTLVVSNSGTEIPPGEINKIFEKFYRIPSSDRWRQGGTGLGLALVKKLTESLDGRITVTSQSNETTFTIQLPLKQLRPSSDCHP